MAWVNMTSKNYRIIEATLFNSLANKRMPGKERKRSSKALLSFYGEFGQNLVDPG